MKLSTLISIALALVASPLAFAIPVGTDDTKGEYTDVLEPHLPPLLGARDAYVDTRDVGDGLSLVRRDVVALESGQKLGNEGDLHGGYLNDLFKREPKGKKSQTGSTSLLRPPAGGTPQVLTPPVVPASQSQGIPIHQGRFSNPKHVNAGGGSVLAPGSVIYATGPRTGQTTQSQVHPQAGGRNAGQSSAYYSTPAPMAAAPPQPQQAVPPRLRNQNQSGDTASGQYGASNRERERGRNPMTGGTLKPPRMLMSNNPPPLPLGRYGGPQNAPPRLQTQGSNPKRQGNKDQPRQR